MVLKAQSVTVQLKGAKEVCCSQSRSGSHDSDLWLAGNEGMDKKMETTIGSRV